MSQLQTQTIRPAPLAQTYAMLVLVCTIWGGTFVAGRFLAGQAPPLLIAALRFLIASAALAAYLAVSRQRLDLPQPRQWLPLAILGFFGIFAYNICFFFSLRFTEASRASLIIALNPAMIALAARLFLKEHLSMRKSAGIVLSLLGTMLVIVSRDGLGQNLSASASDLLILGCVASWVIYSVFSPGLTRALGPLATVAYSIWIGTAMLVVATLFSQPPVSLGAAVARLDAFQWLSLVYLGAAGSALAYILYYEAIRRVGAMRSGAFIALNPITGVFFGWLLFSEAVTPPMLAGGVAVVAGIWLINRTGAKAAP